ncbi:YmL10 [Chamberlinius hualienensis]
MASFKPVNFFSTTWMIVRHKSKPRIQKPRIPHWIKLQVLETTKPVFIPDVIEDHCSQKNATTSSELSTYERLLGQEMLQLLNDSRMVGIYHVNSITERAYYPLKRMMFYEKMRMEIYNKHIVLNTLKGTKYEAITPMYITNTRFLFGEKVDVNALINIQKKWPAFILLAGIVDNRLLSKDELVTYSKLKNLDTVRAQLCATLASPALSMSQSLNYHQVQLGMSLDSLQQKSSEKEETTEKKE